MQRTWNERLSEALMSGQDDALFFFLQEPFPVFLRGASLLSGLIWNTPELLRLTDVQGKGNIPANLSYGSFLNTFARLENNDKWGDVFYNLLFYGIIEPLSQIDQAGRADEDSLQQKESEV